MSDTTVDVGTFALDFGVVHVAADRQMPSPGADADLHYALSLLAQTMYEYGSARWTVSTGPVLDTDGRGQWPMPEEVAADG